MTNLDDLDRSLGEFLADGPNTAPEAAVIAAMAHARTTPRRPDPLSFLRTDVMASPRSVRLGSRPVLIVGLAALMVAGVGAAVIGSRPSDSSVPPGPTPLPSIVSATAPFVADVRLTLAGGNPFTLTVRGTTGELIGAVTGQPGDGSSVTGVAITSDSTVPRVLVVTWVDMPCQTRATMTVDEEERAISILRQDCLGDAIGLDHIVRLTLARDVDPAAWHGDVITSPAETDVPHESIGTGDPEPSGSPLPVAFSFELIDGVDGQTLLDVVDASGHVANAISGQPVDPASVAIMSAVNVDPRTVRVAWRGSSCDAIARLTVAADFGLTIQRPACEGDGTTVYRSAILTFDGDVDADTFDTGLGEVGSGSTFPWAVNGVDSAGGGYNVRVNDASTMLLTVAAHDSRGSATPRSGRVRLDQMGPDGIGVVWAGRACDVAPTILIDTSGTHWLIGETTCSGDATEVIRSVILTFSSPRAVDPIVVGFTPTAP